ncbi:hypothetical protein E2C01_096547 [Portunus trituberculatus]|uniref:Uncharacterized protein n=1 Tax=Portunus trituberculatus TaxID=210409 RepID=A0A5B7K2A7_PORTR|nr:hypothetical protein [Portunus trituberculatus]
MIGFITYSSSVQFYLMGEGEARLLFLWLFLDI